MLLDNLVARESWNREIFIPVCFYFLEARTAVFNRSCHHPAHEIIAYQFIIKPNDFCYFQDRDPCVQYI